MPAPRRYSTRRRTPGAADAGGAQIDLPVSVDDDAAYELLLRAFGFWDLPVGDLFQPFLDRLSPWERQDDLQRVLLLMFEELDHTTEMTRKPAVVDRMRAAVRDALE